jgi:hypothetical protein
MGFIFLKNTQIIEEDSISCFITLNMRVEKKLVRRESNRIHITKASYVALRYLGINDLNSGSWSYLHQR